MRKMLTLDIKHGFLQNFLYKRLTGKVGIEGSFLISTMLNWIIFYMEGQSFGLQNQ